MKNVLRFSNLFTVHTKELKVKERQVGGYALEMNEFSSTSKPIEFEAG